MNKIKALFTLNIYQAKKIIAKGVIKLPTFQRALNEGMIIIANGTTNAYIVEEILGERVAKEKFAAGIIWKGGGSITPKGSRLPPVILIKGSLSDISKEDAIKKLRKGDVFIKGANAIDVWNNIGILVSEYDGGTIGKALPFIQSRKASLIIPVSLEKLIPSVRKAEKVMGLREYNFCRGVPVGMIVLSEGQVITEIEAFKLLFDIEAIPIAAGGINGYEGSITLVCKGEEKKLSNLMALIDKLVD